MQTPLDRARFRDAVYSGTATTDRGEVTVAIFSDSNGVLRSAYHDGEYRGDESGVWMEAENPDRDDIPEFSMLIDSHPQPELGGVWITRQGVLQYDPEIVGAWSWPQPQWNWI